jgi:hypothetical protein
MRNQIAAFSLPEKSMSQYLSAGIWAAVQMLFCLPPILAFLIFLVGVLQSGGVDKLFLQFAQTVAAPMHMATAAVPQDSMLVCDTPPDANGKCKSVKLLPVASVGQALANQYRASYNTCW